MSTPLEYFRLVAPGFSTTGDSTVNKWLTIAAEFVPTGCLTTEGYNMALALYAAHMLQLATASASGGAVGPITSEKEGDLSRSYGATKGDDTVLGSTTYGIQYMDMTKGCYGGAIMTRYGISGQVR